MTITLERAESLGNIARLVPAPRVPDTARDEVEVVEAEVVEAEVGAEDAPAGRSRGRWLTFPVVALLAWFLYGNRSTIQAGFVGLAGASPAWLALAAAVGIGGLTVAGAVAQNGALAVPVPLGRMCAVQLAGSVANQLLPAGTGGMAVNLRFLRRHGMSRSAAAAAMGLNQVAGVVVHVLLLTTVLIAEPGSVPLPHPSVETMVVAILVALLVELEPGGRRPTDAPATGPGLRCGSGPR